MFVLVFQALLFVFCLFLQQESFDVVLFNGVLLCDSFSLYSKRIFLFLFFIFIFYLKFYIDKYVSPFEFFFLLLFFLLSSLILLSVNDFLVLYLAIELQSLSFYILASSKRNSVLAVESGVKYFTLGSLASIFLLFGISLLFFAFGTFNFTDLISNFAVQLPIRHNIVILALISILVSFYLKLAIVPFHNWAPDVYSGTSVIVLCYL